MVNRYAPSTTHRVGDRSIRKPSERPNRTVLGVGELLWDLLPGGPRLGGAPFNAVTNLGRLGHDVRFVTAVGDDDLGRSAVASARGLGVDTAWIARTSAAPTGTVEVTLDATGGPRFRVVSPAAYETIHLGSDDVDAIAAWGPQAVVYGTLAQRFPTVLASTRAVIDRAAIPFRLYDVNLRDGCWDDALVVELLGLATLVKVNADEAIVLGRLLGAAPDQDRLGPVLADRFGIRGVCVTRGRDGAALWLDGASKAVDGLRVDVVDAVGAGDAFAACLLDGLLLGQDPGDALGRANRLGAIVASRSGALPDWSIEELDATPSRHG
jgi:fructokinase